ncbi:hypothetical protein BDW74DRAFT_157041 [Aspergillus multicolor]|uniref:uncharacterized protein n=1 Tax=Aspergillus multicolor TaxID=41759 RepID=UPI003CCE37B6
MTGRNHGSTRGRGRGRRGWDCSRGSPRLVVTEPPAPVVGPLLATISRSELNLSSTSARAQEAPKITEPKLVGSYNWLNRKRPTILVPGSPPAWTPTSTNRKLPYDSGTYFHDQNAARYADHVFQPALEAILKHDPTYDFSKIDVVACGSTFGNLRRFIAEPGKAFRFVVEAIGSAVFLVRRENSPTQTISNVRGYGHTFPEANTTWGTDVKGSESHQRVLEYRFAGLSCLFRYEGDGYLPNIYQPPGARDEIAASTSDDLVSSLQETRVTPVQSEQGKSLAIETGGVTIPQSAIFDLKTRSVMRQYSEVMKEELPRLWLAQVPNFVIGFHKYGVFEDVRVENVREEIRQWEADHEGELRQLSTLLELLIAFAHGQPDGRYEVVFEGADGNGELELREVGGEVNRCISDSMKRRWTVGEGDQDEGKDDDKGTEGSVDGWDERWKEREEELDFDGDSGSEKDFTACSASSCGYCGHCGH